MSYYTPDEDEDRRRLARSWAAAQRADVGERARARIESFDPEGDVRGLEIDHRYDPVAHMLLARGDDFALWIFHTSPDGAPFVPDPGGYTMVSVGNQPLGALAEVQVYATDPHGQCAGQWRGKSHGLCQHQHELSPASHERLTLEEFLPLHQEDPGNLPYPGSGWCSRCGGYALRRLTDEQFSYYLHAVRQAEAQLTRHR